MKKYRDPGSKPGLKKCAFETIPLERYMPFIWISLVAAIVYFQSLFFKFVYFDDNALILDQEYFIRNIGNIFSAFGRDVFGSYNGTYYRPLFNVSLIVNGVIGGVSPFVYHLFNYLVHIAASCIVFVLFIRLGYDRMSSFVCALLFAVLPVLTQNIVWISGRNDSLLLLFIIPAFLCFLSYIEGKKAGSLILHLLFFGLAMFTKEAAIALPLICLFYLRFIRKEKLLSFNKLIFVLSWTAVASLWFVARTFVLTNPVKMSFGDAAKSIASGMLAIVPYIGKIFIPINLAPLPTMQDTTFVFGIIAILLIVIAIFFPKKMRPAYVFLGLFWFFLFLLPSFVYPEVSSIIHYREDRLYVPVIGLLILMLELGPVQKAIENKKIAIPVFGVLIVVFSIVTIGYGTKFSDRMTFWENAVRLSPHSPLAHRNLGAMYYFDKIRDKAEAEYRKALDLNPSEPMAHSNIGAIYFDKGMYKEAETEFKMEIGINPDFDRALYNLGLVYYKLKNYDEAIRRFKEAININNMKLDAYYGIALTYHDTGDEEKAQYYLSEYVKRGGKIPR